MPEQVAPLAYRDPLCAFAPFRDHPMSLLLHGGAWSYLLTNPSEVFQCSDAPGPDLLADIQAWLRAHHRPARGPAPFCGGVAGFFAYEFGALLDPAMPRSKAGRLPHAALGAYRTVAAFDNISRRAFVIGQHADQLAARLGSAAISTQSECGEVEPDEHASAYRAQVAFLLQRIRAGDFFQANISRRYRGRLGDGDHPYAMFARLCRQSPAPYCAYLRLPDAAIVSNSPERLASLTPTPLGLIAATSPIKGTRPRGANAKEDQRLIDQLIASEKDRAENLMIVDLMRNDFAKVSAAGSVRVTQLYALESYANVHHLVSKVEARLRPGLDATNLMRAIFPAGSITGAPKIKAMEIIQQIEQAPREANYGSIAWFGDDGAMESSVLIRTATCFPSPQGWNIEFRVGGGITISSDPAEEARETEVKALSLIKATRNQLT